MLVLWFEAENLLFQKKGVPEMMGEKCEAEDLLELLSCAVTRTCLVMAFQNYECFSKKDNIIKN